MNKFTNMKLLSSWWRWDVFLSEINWIKYAIKKAKDNSKKWAIKKEITILKYLKWKVNFVPQIEDFWEDFFMYKFIEWTTLNKIKNPPKIVYKQLVEYAYILDSLHVEHWELSKPTKNIIVNNTNNVFIIDFERWNLSNYNAKNLKWISRFLLKEKIINLETIINLNKKWNIEEIKKYLLEKLNN